MGSERAKRVIIAVAKQIPLPESLLQAVRENPRAGDMRRSASFARHAAAVVGQADHPTHVLAVYRSAALLANFPTVPKEQQFPVKRPWRLPT